VSTSRLIPAETTLLKRLAGHIPDGNPVSVINSPANFDLCVEQELAQMPREGNAFDEAISLVSSIRRKLGLDHVPRGQFIHSTHGLAPNQELKIALPGEEGREFISSVIRVSEAEIIITVPTKGKDTYLLEEGSAVEVEFVREDDAIYRFHSKVVRNFKGRLPLLFIEHSRKLERVQLRRHFRIEASLPVRCRILKAEELDNPLEAFLGKDDWHDGTITNISGGGALVELDCDAETGDYINFDASLDDDKRDNFTCEIIEVTKKDDKRVAHAAFVGITENMRDKIIKYVFKHQLDSIRKEQKEIEAARARRETTRETMTEVEEPKP
jgi:c-di-GMP-binding flagellar brake protein YcgR